jgi:hypothetical protein
MSTTELPNGELEKILSPDMPFFKELSEEDRKAAVSVYKIKVQQGEITPDHHKGLEEVAKMYKAQKCAFQDVLVKEGFDICADVPQNYAGRIAALTHHGTLIVIGKYTPDGRHIIMTRIHSPELNHNNERGWLTQDLKLKERILFRTTKGPYNGSAARALAINPHGADGDELKAVQDLSESVSEASFRYLKEYGQI